MINTAKQHIARNVAVYVFEVLYFLTTVAGNIAFLTPAGAKWPALFIDGFSWDSFRVDFGIAYWTLLLLPMIAIPVVAFVVSKAMQPVVRPCGGWLSEIPAPIYSVLTALLFAYVFRALGDADALDLMMQPHTAMGAVAARYKIQASLGLLPRIVVMSPLVFLSIYAIVRSARGGGWFWHLASVVVAVSLAAALTLLNMKWPVVVYLLLVTAAIFVLSKRFAITKAAVSGTLAIAVYLLISVVLMRFAALPSEYSHAEPRLHLASYHTIAVSSEKRPVTDAGKTISSMVRFAPRLLIVALTRMAQAMPYYYAVFTEHGPVCGTIIDRIERKPSPCQPSRYIYDQMFPGDQFNGTAPAAVNFYGYALNGWAGAVVETVLGGILLGAFGALRKPAQSKPILMASYIMGAYAAYFLTQVPIEAAVIYAHGLAWWAIMVLALSILSLPFARRARSSQRASF